jgi:acetoin utilization deacetylase AcuC-like enzyme
MITNNSAKLTLKGRKNMSKAVIFHEDYYLEYTFDPAAKPGRMEAIMEELSDFTIISPSPATIDDVLLVHTEDHVSRVRNESDRVYQSALLAVGGTLLAAEYGYNQQPMFALIRPPGHHASPDGYWGFCYFNNIAIAVRYYFNHKQMQNALIIDFDLHFGDGSHNTFQDDPLVTYYSGEGATPEEFIANLIDFLAQHGDVDFLAVSAGFDRHEDDWGNLLSTNDYRSIGSILKSFSEDHGDNRRFACLEGGYNHSVLGKNVRAFIEGFY